MSSLSFKRYFFIIEIITFILLISILILSIFLSTRYIIKSSFEKQDSFTSSFLNQLDYIKNHWVYHISFLNKEEEIEEFLKYGFEEFFEIFTIDSNYTVKKIYRIINEIIFPGFSYRNLYLKEYIEKNKDQKIFTTDVLKSINNSISFYIIKHLDSNDYLIAKVDIDKMIEDAIDQLNITGSFFVIARDDNYIIYNSNKEVQIYFLPNVNKFKFTYIEKKPYFLYNLKGPFENKFYLFLPFNYFFKDITTILFIYFFIFLFFIIFIFIKSKINNKYFIHPLTNTINIIAKWDVSELENEIPKFFLGFREIVDLINTITQKYFEFANQYEQLQQTQKTIQRMQKYLKNLIDSLPSAIISVDLQGKIIQFNKKAEEFTGKNSNEAIGKNYDQIFPYLAKFQNNFKQAISNDKMIIINKDYIDEKNEKIVNVNIIPISQNGLSGAAFRIDDITEFENLEKQIRLSQKLEIIGLLSGGIAHDLNNVLSGIISTVSLMKTFLVENPSFKNPELIEYIDILENSSSRTKDIVQKLLTLSRKKEGKKVPLNLKTCLNDVERICKSTFDKSIELKFINPFSEATILGEQNLIIQSILNLCINASHAMTIMRKPGEKIGGKLIVKLEKADEKEIAINNLNKDKRIKDQYWKITVNDNGVGISENVKDRIFEPFFTTKEAFYGTGIGLSTVKMIVEDHEGFINFESKVGGGTSFYVYLPILKIESFFEEKNYDNSIKKGFGLVLLIDDEELIRTITKSMLTKLGYNVLTASNYEEAILIFKRHLNNIKVVILDIAIPGKSGIEIFKEFKKLRNNINILFITGLKLDENIEEIVKNEADGFLPKPFTISELSNAIFKIFKNKNDNK